MTVTCTNCIRWDSILPPVCGRATCDPVDAPCQQHGVSERVWSCLPGTDGINRCYERCTDGGYNCFIESDFCRSGFCG